MTSRLEDFSSPQVAANESHKYLFAQGLGDVVDAAEGRVLGRHLGIPLGRHEEDHDQDSGQATGQLLNGAISVNDDRRKSRWEQRGVSLARPRVKLRSRGRRLRADTISGTHSTRQWHPPVYPVRHTHSVTWGRGSSCDTEPELTPGNHHRR